MQFKCAQKGCEFDADDAPDDCPVCGNPFIEGPDLADYSALTKASLIDELGDRELEPADLEQAFSRWSKDDLISALQMDDARPEDQDDD